ncbi:hypothetical protein LCGC14_2891670, partial [marine sediment metagenome]
RYILYGVRTGDFLEGVLTNDLSRAVIHADLGALPEIHAIVRLIYNHVPLGCHSLESGTATRNINKLEDWITGRGYKGIQEDKRREEEATIARLAGKSPEFEPQSHNLSDNMDKPGESS